MQEWTVNLGELKIQSSISVESKNVSSKSLLLSVSVKVVAKVAYTLEIRKIEGIIDSDRLACFIVTKTGNMTCIDACLPIKWIISNLVSKASKKL